ncbi:MAG TPA: hypothetical protein VHP14_08150 [Anaerolineales bacterium]|nr:hypothetical protein [Anaerolineales bacterium]
MHTQEILSKTQVGVIIVTGGCCGGDTSGAVARAKSFIEKLGAELGVQVLIKELGGAQAMRGGLPARLIAEARESYARLGRYIVPAIIINGNWVPLDETALRNALLDARRAQTASGEENPNE